MAPNNRLGGQVMHASIALGVVATISVILRFVARWKSKANFGSDDIFIAISLILHYLMIVVNSQGPSTISGLQKHGLNIRQLFLREASECLLKLYHLRRCLFS